MSKGSDSDFEIDAPADANLVFAKLAAGTDLVPVQETCRINTQVHAQFFPERNFTVLEDTTDAAHLLSEHLMYRFVKDNYFLYEKNVLELGAGTGLVGLLAVLLAGPPEVVASDGRKEGFVHITDLDFLLGLIRRNAELNLNEDERRRLDIWELRWFF
ncbi:hypothetical protein HK096_004221 [Nowakowskiella sp. JEL0078]|nr:hypothetical protein HK096_004221 [Nowakowskiella sp. JEL0078]